MSWNTSTRNYSAEFPFSGRLLSWMWIVTRWVPLNSCLLVSATAFSYAQMPAGTQNNFPLSNSSPASSALSLTGPGPNGVLSTFDAVTGSQTDVLFGRNGVNSYTLSWINPRFNSDTVVSNGRIFQRDSDYTLDYTNGAISFTHGIPAGVMVRVSYSVDSFGAAHNALAVPAPLYWDLWQNGTNRLRLRMVDRQDNFSNDPMDPFANDYGRNALQWTGNNRFLKGPGLNAQLDTKLFMDLRGGDLLQHGGYGLGERTHWGKADLGLSYSRAGSLFTQSQESGFTAGQESLEAKLSIVPTKGLTIAGGVKQTTTQPGTTSADTPSSSLVNTSLLNTSPAVVKEANVSISAEVAALKKTKLSAMVTDRYDKDGEHRNGEALVQLPKLPIGQTQLSGGVQIATDPGQERLVGIFAATTHPVRYLEFAGDARLRNSLMADDKTDPNALNTYGFKLNFAPSKRFQLTGGITINPEQDGSVKKIQRNAFGLQTDWGLLAFHSQVGVDQDYISSRFSDTSEVGVDFHVTRADTFTTGFRGQNYFNQSTTGTYSYLLGFKRRLGSAVDLMINGSYTQSTNSAETAKPELKTEAKVGLKF